MSRRTRMLDCLKVTPRFERSVNVERDMDDERLVSSFTATDAAERTIQLVADGLAANRRSIALSIAGPYGCGKSSFAQWFSALLGPSDWRPAKAAATTLRAMEMAAGAHLLKSLAGRDRATDGWVRAIAVAERGPLSTTILRALHRALESHPVSKTAKGRKVLAQCDALIDGGRLPSSSAVVNLVATTASAGPGLLLLIDEFGRCLEHAVASGDASSFALLQDLAEFAPASESARLVLMTLSHQSFADYADAVSSQMRREWAKVQGRFADVPYLSSTSQSLRILSQAIQWRPSPQAAASRERARSVDAAAKAVEALDLGTIFGTTVKARNERMLSVYPLSPLAAVVAVELARQFGQSERSLFTFLASAEPGGFQSLADSLVAGEQLGVQHLAEYFLLGLSSRDAGRLGTRTIEIWDRLREASRAALPESDQSLLFTIGLINLAGHPKLRASDSTLAAALPPSDARSRAGALKRLQGAGWIIHRAHADEYRVWQGADFDLTGAIAQARGLHGQRPDVEILSASLSDGSFVARRVSVERGTFRKFAVQWVASERDLRPTPDGCSGIVAIATDPRVALPAADANGWPIVSFQPTTLHGLRQLSLDVQALRDVLSQARREKVEAPALREIGVRLREAERELEDLWLRTLATCDGKITCGLLRATKARRGRGLSEFLSHVVDKYFPDTPTIRNEILNRDELSSAGARAQRELIAGILKDEEKHTLGLEVGSAAWGMYLGVLQYHALHDLVAGNTSIHALKRPKRGSDLERAWNAIETFYKTTHRAPQTVAALWELLLKPPIGLPNGTIPVLLAVSLQLHRGDVAVFKDGVYLTQVEPEDFELLVKVPERYTLKQVALGSSREAILRAVTGALNGPGKVRAGARNASILEAVAPLARLVTRAVKPVVLSSSLVTSPTKAVARAVLEARDPERLVFEGLPTALGVKLSKKPTAEEVAEFAHRLERALHELTGAYQLLLSEIATRTFAAFNTAGDATRAEARGTIARRCAALVALSIDMELKAFLTRASDDMLQEAEWSQSLGMLLVGRPVEQWHDDHFNHFSVAVLAMARRIDRFEATCFSLLPGEQPGRQAVCLTVTNANGQESRAVVSMLEAQHPALRKVAEALRSALGTIDPAHRTQALAIMVCESLAGAASEATLAVQPTLPTLETSP